MDDINWLNEPPKKSGKYLVSLHQHKASGVHVSNYVAHYDDDQKKWHRYDPFSDNEIGEEIEDAIVGYYPVVSFLGVAGKKIN